MSGIEPIDMAVIRQLKLRYGDRASAVLVDLADTCLVEAQFLKRAMETEDAGRSARISHAMHRLRSVGVTLGAHEVVALCDRYMDEMKAGHDTRMSIALADLLSALVRAVAFLKRLSAPPQARTRTSAKTKDEHSK